MANDIQLYSSQDVAITQVRGNYELQGVMGGETQLLKRGVHFDVIPRTKAPTLLKAGAEAVCKAFGVFPRFRIESKIEQFEPTPFFHYLVECQLIKINPLDGKEYIFASAFGSANTSEKRNGFNGACDSANSTCKMAQKRALTAAAITLGGLSSLFSQDLDNEAFMNNAQSIIDSTNPDAPISAKQTKRIFALAADLGLNAEQAKNKLKAAGFNSTKDVKQKDYDAVCNLFMADSAKEEPKAAAPKKPSRKKSSEA